MPSIELHLGDCLEIMPGIADSSIDFIFTDPPYPYIKREYGYWTEETWIPMMQEVVRQGRRILKPRGSMVMVLQPNSEKVGKMRLWLWRFMLWCGEYWNIVQDAYWWNYATLPTGVCNPRERGLLKASIKPCLWVGESNCYRNQDNVLNELSERTIEKITYNSNRVTLPSGQGVDYKKLAQTSISRGGSIPCNLLPISNNGNGDANGHGAGTPLKLTDWWLRYLTKPGDTVLDPFNGSGTTGVAALNLGRKYVGVEKYPKYFEITKARLAEAQARECADQLAFTGVI